MPDFHLQSTTTPTPPTYTTVHMHTLQTLQLQMCTSFGLKRLRFRDTAHMPQTPHLEEILTYFGMRFFFCLLKIVSDANVFFFRFFFGAPRLGQHLKIDVSNFLVAYPTNIGFPTTYKNGDPHSPYKNGDPHSPYKNGDPHSPV